MPYKEKERESQEIEFVPGKLYRLRRKAAFFLWPHAYVMPGGGKSSSYKPGSNRESYVYNPGKILMFLKEMPDQEDGFSPFYVFLAEDKVVRCSRFVSSQLLSKYFEEAK